MIIQCPACATRYVVPDTAIGVDGRTVRCAKCRHSWFQDAGELPQRPASPAPPVASPTPDAPVEREPESAANAQEPTQGEPARRTDFEREPMFAPESPPVPRPVAQVSHVDERQSHFDSAPPFRRRINPLKMWSWAAGIFAVVAAGLILAVSFFGLPDWVPVSRPTFAAAQPDLQLDFPAERQEQRQLPNGKEFFAASGTVTNIGTTTRAMPTILIVLRDARDRIVFSWEVPPPQRSIAPGESVAIDEAVTDIPRSARFAEIGWKPE